ncbi:hypothetical protein [Tenacibaculum caenipelagi]|uniref:Hypervirulence associated protein TUDOR domain-containing protein n=1 Tax=Tenacibaculum caenipelagi TaxID=1325435 RepID=A0A4R6T9S6_9FLAO|nr:hypothetical protein [Tenacibaculum caenipelagi]TDQ22766.1 hypothetical protein DFQ07_2784 [Tenacibaculum caenipelagi]
MKNLKKGNKVVMHSCIEAKNPKYKGKLIECRTDSYLSKDGEEVVFLDGVSGYFSTRFLEKVEL